MRIHTKRLIELPIGYLTGAGSVITFGGI
jgi:hypothetical protein